MNQIAGSVRFLEKFCESCSINWGISFLINGSGRSGRRVTDWHILKRNLSVEKKKKLKTQSKEAYYKLKSKLAITGNKYWKGNVIINVWKVQYERVLWKLTCLINNLEKCKECKLIEQCIQQQYKRDFQAQPSKCCWPQPEDFTTNCISIFCCLFSYQFF